MSKKFWSFKKTATPAIKVDKNELKKKLTPIQYRVTQEAATERPFSGEYLKLKENGMYACIVCGQEMFSSECKYESGCGWPAFFQPEDDNKLILRPDLSHVGGNILLLALKPDLARTEVTCGNCGAHMGHVFDDGPKPTGKRYCINSAALKFSKKTEESLSIKDNHSQQTPNNSERADQPKTYMIDKSTDTEDLPKDRAIEQDFRSQVTLRGRNPRQVMRTPSYEAPSVRSSQDRLSLYSQSISQDRHDNNVIKRERRRSSSAVITDRVRFFTSINQSTPQSAMILRDLESQSRHPSSLKSKVTRQVPESTSHATTERLVMDNQREMRTKRNLHFRRHHETPES